MSSKSVLKPKFNSARNAAQSKAERLSLTEALEDVAAEHSLDGRMTSPELMEFVLGKIERFRSLIQSRRVYCELTPEKLMTLLMLEIVELGVGISEVCLWLSHEPTVDEILFGDDDSSMEYLYKKKRDGLHIYERISELMEKHEPRSHSSKVCD